MKKRLIVAALTVCMILTMLPAAALAAQGVSYIERRWENNTVVSVEKTAESYTVVTSSVTVWTTGWYVVTGSVTIGGGVTVDGDVHLILADGCKLTVSKPSSSRKAGINVADGNSLTIYGQAGETGSLTVEGGYRGAGIGGIGGNYDVGQNCGTVIIHGGKINTKGNYSAGIGGGSGDNDYKGGAGGTVTIYGGTVEADGGESGAGIGGGMGLGSGDGGNGGTVTIYGGNVTAKGNSGIGGADCGGTGSSAIISTGGTGGKVTIFGGTVTAEGGLGAGIGGGGEGGCRRRCDNFRRNG
jgi:hypothetical protein